LVTPGGVPGVSNDVVSLVTLVAPADCLNGVVERCRAVVSFSNDSACIALEDLVSSSDGDTDRAHFKTSLDAVGVLSDLSVVGNQSDSLGFVVNASGLVTSGARSVRVAILGHGHVCLVPFPGVVVPATVASVVAEETLGAVDELLGAHDSLVVSGNNPAGLGGFSGRESPA